MADLSRLLRLKLGEGPQPAGHPDVNVLAAFAENALLRRERAEVTNHLARCAECREYLAVAGAAWEPEPSQAEAPAPPRLKRWYWLAVAAAACVVVVVMLPRRRPVELPALPASQAIASRTEALPSAPPAAPQLSARRQAPATGQRPVSKPQPLAAAPVEIADAVRAPEYANDKGAPMADRLMKSAGDAPAQFGQQADVDVLRQSAQVKLEKKDDQASAENRLMQAPGGVAGGALAQRTYGSITGRVIDQSGAAIAKAKVNAVNTATNKEVPATTNRDGTFEVAGLDPGSYRLNVEAPGFKTQGSGPIALRAGDVSSQDLRLDVGSVSESVTVAAETPRLKSPAAAAALPARNRAAAAPRVRWSISASGAVERSLDGGTTWEAVPLGHNVIFRAVAADGPHVWAGGTDGVLFHSSDAGSHWTESKLGAAALVSIDAQNRGRLKVTNSSGDEWISGDSGLHWNR